MISIFNGRSRELGDVSSKKVYVQVSVAMRRYLHKFKGAKFSVFMAIALHANEEGWSTPSVKALRRETGYNKDTIFAALAALCQVEIEGHRVLLRSNRRGDAGTFENNSYLIFPSREEVAKYEGEIGPPYPKNTDTEETRHGENPTRENSESGKFGHKENNKDGSKEEPSLEEKPHTHESQASFDLEGASESNEESHVCVLKELTLADYRKFARSQSSFHTPDAWAYTHFNKRDRDELVGEWLHSQTPEQIAEARSTEQPAMTYFEAAQIVETMRQVGRAPQETIADLEVDEEVRARLLEKFCPPQTDGEESGA